MSLTTQFYTMIAMIAMGSYFGIALDTYKRLFQRSKRKLWFVFLNDILFWILQALIIFYILYIVNNGEIRFYIFLALLCGFAFYQSLLKNFYTRMLEWNIQFTIKTYQFITRLIQVTIIRPIVVIVTFVFSVFLGFGQFLLRLFKRIVKILWWIIRLIFKPFMYLARLIWKLLPNSVRIGVSRVLEIIVKLFQWMKHLFKKDSKE